MTEVKSRIKSYIPVIVMFIVIVSITISGYSFTESYFRQATQAEFDRAAEVRRTPLIPDPAHL